MRKLIAIGSATALLLPALAFAAFDDATLTSDVALSVGGITVNVTGSNTVVESIAVGASSFTAVLKAGSSLNVSAPSLNQLSADTDTGQIEDVCNTTESVLAYAPTSDVTVTITPSADACTAAAPHSGGGGGGGGGGSSSTATTPTPAATTTATVTTPSTNPTIAALQAQLSGLLAQLQSLKGGAPMSTGVSASFARNLEMGATGEDVKALQVYLNTHGFAIASSGPGSSGNETTKFGGLTKAALIKLQIAAGITPAAGYFGPKTRAYVGSHP